MCLIVGFLGEKKGRRNGERENGRMRERSKKEIESRRGVGRREAIEEE